MTYVLCHLSKDEINNLNAVQKKAVYDKETGIRKLPVLKNTLSTTSSLSYFTDHLWDKLEENKIPSWIANLPPLPPVNSIGVEENPDHISYSISQKGIKDKNLALCPEESIHYLMRLSPDHTINPQTGLFEFNKFKNFIRLLAPVIGGIWGGGSGAALGSVAGGLLTGRRKAGDLASHAVKSYGLGMAASELLGGSKGMASLLDKIPGGEKAKPYLWNYSEKTEVNPHDKDNTKVKSEEKELGGFSKLFQELKGLNTIEEGKHFFPSLLKASTEYDKKQKALEKQRKEQEALENTPPEEEFTLDIEPFKYRKGGQTPPPSSGKSTPIEGKGDGQSDEIKTSVQAGDWIFHASLVAALGNGSTSAGFAILKEFVKLLKAMGGQEKKTEPTKVALSDGEFDLNNGLVEVIGELYGKPGVDVLDDVVKKVMAYHTSKGKELPPPIGTLEKFLSFFPKIPNQEA